jgi:hypothetical protein
VDSPGHLTRSEYRAATRAPQEKPLTPVRRTMDGGL